MKALVGLLLAILMLFVTVKVYGVSESKALSYAAVPECQIVWSTHAGDAYALLPDGTVAGYSAVGDGWRKEALAKIDGALTAPERIKPSGAGIIVVALFEVFLVKPDATVWEVQRDILGTKWTGGFVGVHGDALAFGNYSELVVAPIGGATPCRRTPFRGGRDLHPSAAVVTSRGFVVHNGDALLLAEGCDRATTIAQVQAGLSLRGAFQEDLLAFGTDPPGSLVFTGLDGVVIGTISSPRGAHVDAYPTEDGVLALFESVAGVFTLRSGRGLHVQLPVGHEYRILDGRRLVRLASLREERVVARMAGNLYGLAMLSRESHDFEIVYIDELVEGQR